MKHFKRYNSIILVPVSLLFLAVLGFAFVIEPLNGHLTRIGGYAENDFGWNQPQERLQSKLYSREKNGTLNKYHDVIVFGDSFSNSSPREVMHPAGYWPNYLVKETGLDLITFHVFDTNLIKLIDSDAFKKFPPRLFIYEVVERDAISNLAKIEGDCKLKKSPQIKPFLIKPYQNALLTFERNIKTGILDLNFDQSIDYLKKSVIRKANHNFSETVKIALDRKGLFSSKMSEETLVFKSDFKFRPYNEARIKKGLCGLINLQNKIQSNNKTLFVALIAPDKLSAYSDHSKSFRNKGNSLFYYFSKQPVNLPRVDLALNKEIEKGIVDVYLPNDTHWGSWGHRTAAQTIIDYLENHGFLIKRKFSEN
jgi:acetyltransferase AlgX (SGNH hydrolase-like protein)